MYHEPVEELPQETRDITRAIVSMKEELEAIDWYNQRAAATQDQELKNLLIHNRDEEIEHASMLMEWLRRLIPAFDEELRTYLFTQGPIDTIEEQQAAAEEGGGNEASAESDAQTSTNKSNAGDLGIGKMK